MLPGGFWAALHSEFSFCDDASQDAFSCGESAYTPLRLPCPGTMRRYLPQLSPFTTMPGGYSVLSPEITKIVAPLHHCTVRIHFIYLYTIGSGTKEINKSTKVR